MSFIALSIFVLQKLSYFHFSPITCDSLYQYVRIISRFPYDHLERHIYNHKGRKSVNCVNTCTFAFWCSLKLQINGESIAITERQQHHLEQGSFKT